MSYAGVAKYQQNDVFSMSPARRLVFLYGQVVANLRQAGRFLERGEVEARSRALTRARDIMGELLCTLNFQEGGEIAANLASLYLWMMDETLEVDRRRDPKRLERLTAMVAELHAAWEQAAAQVPELHPAAAVGE
ncbi:MAG: flagellar export chaperone FliS [Gemmatimonadetes bacterium]|nr:flagellar export chaperone FliS [Gemmatimonadota bacterium]MBP6669155.1 flagellar export chaperone FliS [Gemmatimonadales bacterium]MBK6778265.1 flagellar export chaperone FliS [Gemmatimonadota bacterium]MBK7349425.1 flagellar export chaperone FliS [Gemmatimonadota bacterium]MBK7716437.1 flagellar export chaperone FliS [Gemmatimonadota bacterium]